MFGDYLLVSARRMIQVMSGATDPRLQQLQVKRLKILLFLNLMKYQLLVKLVFLCFQQKCLQKLTHAMFVFQKKVSRTTQ